MLIAVACGLALCRARRLAVLRIVEACQTDLARGIEDVSCLLGVRRFLADKLAHQGVARGFLSLRIVHRGLEWPVERFIARAHLPGDFGLGIAAVAHPAWGI